MDRVLHSAWRLVAVAYVALSYSVSQASPKLPDTILFGVAYYDEYMPVDRIDVDARMMKAAGIGVVRIAESTWGTLERRPGVFDFTSVDRALRARASAQSSPKGG